MELTRGNPYILTNEHGVTTRVTFVKKDKNYYHFTIQNGFVDGAVKFTEEELRELKIK